MCILSHLISQVSLLHFIDHPHKSVWDISCHLTFWLYCTQFWHKPNVQINMPMWMQRSLKLKMHTNECLVISIPICCRLCYETMLINLSRTSERQIQQWNHNMHTRSWVYRKLYFFSALDNKHFTALKAKCISKLKRLMHMLSTFQINMCDLLFQTTCSNIIGCPQISLFSGKCNLGSFCIVWYKAPIDICKYL